jgi:hypothetical protein
MFENDKAISQFVLYASQVWSIQQESFFFSTACADEPIFCCPKPHVRPVALVRRSFSTTTLDPAQECRVFVLPPTIKGQEVGVQEKCGISKSSKMIKRFPNSYSKYPETSCTIFPMKHPEPNTPHSSRKPRGYSRSQSKQKNALMADCVLYQRQASQEGQQGISWLTGLSKYNQCRGAIGDIDYRREYWRS